jgi:hypothetical protein
MVMLTSLELAQLRRDVDDLLPDTCNILRPASTVDDAGNVIETMSTAVAGTPCRLDPFQKSSGELSVVNQEIGRSYWWMTVKHNTDIRIGDRVVFDSDNYEVVQLFDDHSLRVVRRVMLAKLQPDPGI